MAAVPKDSFEEGSKKTKWLLQAIYNQVIYTYTFNPQRQISHSLDVDQSPFK